MALPYEIILIPNGTGDLTHERSLVLATDLAERHPCVVVVDHRTPTGKGAALKSGYIKSRGQWIFFIDADLPYDLGFFTKAMAELEQGADFVTGNRRLLNSSFSFPVSLLPIVYRRHRLGLWFNFCVRFLFRLKTSDTQAGIKAMTRRFADAAFSHQTCPGFLADVEYFVSCREGKFQHVELPVQFFLASEKSTVRLFRELFTTLYWLPRLYFQKVTGWYSES